MIDPRRILRSFTVRGERVAGLMRVFLTPGISAGKGVTAGRGCCVVVTDGGTCAIGPGTTLKRNVEITVKRGELAVGAACFIGPGSIIVARKRIVIGDGCQIAEYVTIRDNDHRLATNGTLASRGFNEAPILIEKNVWIGAKATITRGVRIGENAVVAAGAVVTHNVPANTLVAGVPARVIKEIST